MRWLLLFVAFSLFSQDIKGILFLGSGDNTNTLEPGVHALRVPLLEESPQFLLSLQDRFLGKPLDLETLDALKAEVKAYYAEKSNPFVVVTVPEQEVTDGFVTIFVEEPTLGEVRLSGNSYFSDEMLESYLRVKPGDPISTKKLMADLAAMNQNPFRRTDAFILGGARPGTVDLELYTVERWPRRFYAGADNTGTSDASRNRIFAGVNISQFLYQDCELAYQFTTAPDIGFFSAQTGQLRFPLPWRDTIIIYGGYARTKPDFGLPGFKETMISWQIDFRYRHPLPLFGQNQWNHTLTFGFDFKRLNNRIDIGEIETVANADLDQWMVGYDAGYQSKRNKVIFAVELFFNAPGLSAYDHTSNLAQFRFDPNALYSYIRFNHSFSHEVGGCSFVYNLSGQLSSTNLLPSEQFGLGGYETVRGYEERILTLDNACLFNFEFHSPTWRCYDQKLYGLLFFDYGLGANHHSLPGDPSFKNLASLGPGARYEWSHYLSARIDYGVQLWYTGFSPGSHSRMNFGVVLSY